MMSGSTLGKITGYLPLVVGFAMQRSVARPVFSNSFGSRAVASGAMRVVVPKWLDAPHSLNAVCSDPVYEHATTVTLLDNARAAGATLRLLHSGFDVFLCANSLPNVAGGHLLVRVDVAPSRPARLKPQRWPESAYQFAIARTGQVEVDRRNSSGAYPMLAAAKGQASGVAADGTQETWSAEMRISLELLGGYGRVDRVQFAFQQGDGKLLQTWPRGGKSSATNQWGELVLTPVSPVSVTAGSGFLDGRNGYFVVPYSPDLNPQAITIEAWARAADPTSCGTLVGNGQASSYWFALCGLLQFGYGGKQSTLSGQSRLDKNWHHVAVSMGDDGTRTYYLDGQIDLLPDWQPAQESSRKKTDLVGRLGASSMPLRVGADRDLPANGLLHGNVRQLRIWNRVRSADEIRGDAFRQLKGNEPGLIALWPFTTGLQDIVGGRNAGLIGNASLTREAPQIDKFPTKPVHPPAMAYPVPVADRVIAPWDANIPVIEGEITVDGACGADEYRGAAKLPLEPSRKLSMYVTLTREALYFCTTVLFGDKGHGSSFSLFIDSSFGRNAPPSPAPMHIHITPDGNATETIDGSGTAHPVRFESETFARKIYGGEDDMRALQAPWWSSEVRIPLGALKPFHPGRPLRLAVLYKGFIPVESGSSGTERSQLSAGQWPAKFEAEKPATWGVASTGDGSLVVSETRMNAPARSASTSISLGEDGTSASRATSASAADDYGAGITTESFCNSCPCSWLGENLCVGCITDPNSKWPRVSTLPETENVKAEGTLTEIDLSNEDWPGLHNSHDVDMKITPSPGFRWIGLSDQPPGQVLETESAGFPAKASPMVSDHVTVYGRWIYDCGHDPKTEIHPVYVFESDHSELRPVMAQTQEVKAIRLWMNSDPGRYFPQDLPESFSFDITMPPIEHDGRDEVPFLAVEQQDPAVDMTAITATLSYTADGRSIARITVRPKQRAGQFFWQIVVGFLHGEEPQSAGLYTVTLDQIDILDDHRLLSGGEFPGYLRSGWFMNLNLNGIGREVFRNTAVASNTGVDFPFGRDQTPRGPYALRQAPSVTGYDPTARAFDRLWLQVEGWAKNGGDNEGEHLFAGQWCLGQLSALSQAGPQQFPRGSPQTGDCDGSVANGSFDWRLHYTVTPTDDSALQVFGDTVFWFDYFWHSNNAAVTNLGVLSSPHAIDAPTGTFLQSGRLRDRPLIHDNVMLIGSMTEDQYEYTLSDFAFVDLNPGVFRLPSGITAETVSEIPWDPEIPSDINQNVGPKGAIVRVTGESGLGLSGGYTLDFESRFRGVNPDLHASLDVNHPRLIDLSATPEQWLWSWQATEGRPPNRETHYYEVRFLVTPAPTSVCDVRTDPSIDIYAWGMHLTITNEGSSFRREVEDGERLTDLSAHFPSGRIFVAVGSQAGQWRRVYRFDAEWHPPVYVPLNECPYAHQQQRQVLNELKRMSAYWGDPFLIQTGTSKPPPLISHIPSAPGGPNGPEFLVPLRVLGSYTPIALGGESDLDLTISSVADRPFRARLYDDTGVMLGGSQPMGEAARRAAHSHSGLIPQSRLRVADLITGRIYILQLIPDFSTESVGGRKVERVILSRASLKTNLP